MKVYTTHTFILDPSEMPLVCAHPDCRQVTLHDSIHGYRGFAITFSPEHIPAIISLLEELHHIEVGSSCKDEEKVSKLLDKNGI